MKNKDAKDYTDAAELIASGENDFACFALEFKKNSSYKKGVSRPDLVEPFKKIFRPSLRKYHYVFWNEHACPNCPTKTDSYEHSRECRIFALLFMAEMTENP